MKRILYSFAVGAMALTACTSDEVIQESVQGNAIGFQNAVSKESRALNNASLNSFFVYGYYTKNGFEASPVQVFDGVKVTKDEKVTPAAWGYTDTRYWVPSTTYYFYAYSCDNNSLNEAFGNAAINLDGDDVEDRALCINEYIANNSHQHDLIYASNDAGIQGKESGNAKVPFTFNHILTRVNVKFTSDFAAGYDIKVSDVKIENIYDKASYNPYGEPVWSSNSRTTTSPFIELSVPADANIASKANGEIAEKTVTTGAGYVIPWHYTTTNVRLVFTVEISSGEGTGKVVILNRTLTGTWKPNWVSGNAYTYNVTIAGTNTDLEPIVFETADNMNLDGWDNGSTTEVNFSFSTN